MVEFDFQEINFEEGIGFMKTLESLKGEVEEERDGGANKEEGNEDQGPWN
jgi:hypothetical protein